MNIPDNILQAAIDAAFEATPDNYCASLIYKPEEFKKTWEKEAPARLDLFKHALAAIAPHLPTAGVGEYTNKEIQRAWNNRGYLPGQRRRHIQELRAFMAALPRRESPALAEAIARAEKAEAELATMNVDNEGLKVILAVETDAKADVNAELAKLKAELAALRLPAAQPAPAATPASAEEVPLGPEDCPPGSVIRPMYWDNGWIAVIKACVNDCICDGKAYAWHLLHSQSWQINTSIPDTGRWDATVWRKACKKK